MKRKVGALAMVLGLSAATLPAHAGAATGGPDDALSYCAQQADLEQVARDGRAEYIEACVGDRRDALQSDEGDAIDKGAGRE